MKLGKQMKRGITDMITPWHISAIQSFPINLPIWIQMNNGLWEKFEIYDFRDFKNDEMVW